MVYTTHANYKYIVDRTELWITVCPLCSVYVDILQTTKLFRRPSTGKFMRKVIRGGQTKAVVHRDKGF